MQRNGTVLTFLSSSLIGAAKRGTELRVVGAAPEKWMQAANVVLLLRIIGVSGV